MKDSRGEAATAKKNIVARTDSPASVVEERLQAALDSDDLGIWDHDLRENTFWASPNIIRMVGIPEGGPASTRLFWEFVHPDDRDGVRQVVRGALAAAVSGHFEVTFRAHRRDLGRLALVRCSAQLVFDQDNRPARMLGVFRDVSDQQEEQVKLFYEAHYDELTGLANQKLLTEQTQSVLDQERPAGCLLLELDGFQEVSDTLGQEAGNRLLQLTAARLTRLLPEGALLSRTTGEEFAVMLPDQDQARALIQLAEAVHGALLETFMIKDRPVAISGHVGIAFAAPQGCARTLLSDAHLALADAKAAGYGASRVYQPALRKALRARQDMSADLRTAVLGEQFELYYQPQVRLSDGKIVGAEALLRWHHPHRGLLAPGEFLPLLKGSPMARILGDWVIRQACAKGALLHRQGRPLCMAFSAQFKLGGLARMVADTLRETGLPGEGLEIEITERVIINSDNRLKNTLNDLRSLGCQLAFDDFGTGYASLSMLKEFPITRLKVDKSFVDAIHESGEDHAVVQAMIQLAETFGFSITAEGIETEQQAEVLRQLGCREGQGYLFGKPMPWQELYALL
ncbi:diguanylate cyclase/phosphodiesterase [Alcanivorax venustensis ISO4]|uniref:Diguanylate cyclase/phosphodiesterase n=1 Tax=Alloalcanivorax venustensis ISO4 TaxID=1177184 RepID=A0ABS0AJW5_9GAMM|nr:GGDEF domain-containing phosphodiesterase [Alloalcanivorax venustensis]MBF5054437.1 diguanylate cyclase/phosphodiesterase [Alloalcanivorax venustensis ISO4]